MKLSKLPLALALLIMVKLALDYFAYHVSGSYGVYGLQVSGEWFSGKYYLSWLVALVVFFSALPYLSVCCDEIDYAVVFLFLATFLPSATVFWVADGDFSFFAFDAAFWIGCSVIFYFLSELYPWQAARYDDARVSRWETPFACVYAAIVSLLLLNLLRSYNIGLDFSFASVYARRKEFVEWLSGAWTYPYAWSVYVFAVFLIFIPRLKTIKLLGIGYVLVFFLSAGDKVYLFLVFLIIAFLLLRGISIAVTLILAAFAGLFTAASIFDSVWLGFIVNRFVILPLDIAFKYASHFSGEYLMYSYSFLSKVFHYSYDGAPAQIIGDIYYLKGDGANVNFLADAYVNFGWLSIAPLLGFFAILRTVFRDSKYLILLTPLLIQLMNAPLPTVLLTGGGVLMILSCYLLSRSVSVAAPASGLATQVP
ncbi:hypothetical protein RA280_08175 [Cupriavidus sp. CV2]|uniref:hypothetical protein n=1 Tax=Cupriavidus ulmosensis TaxID=3065913 RepID=UPI00296AEC75|nr:hypothetical protein [Cupriavidus sp. CV2]MDW3681724.1 hypothetical protein [Cupriavidus sp. CV2]